MLRTTTEDVFDRFSGGGKDSNPRRDGGDDGQAHRTHLWMTGRVREQALGGQDRSQPNRWRSIQSRERQEARAMHREVARRRKSQLGEILVARYIFHSFPLAMPFAD